MLLYVGIGCTIIVNIENVDSVVRNVTSKQCQVSTSFFVNFVEIAVFKVHKLVNNIPKISVLSKVAFFCPQNDMSSCSSNLENLFPVLNNMDSVFPLFKLIINLFDLK